jgi:uncharacterized membrane-anchored protein
MNSERFVSKLPAVTFGFWITKILATTLGETGGDAVTMSLDLGYLVGSLIFATFFIVTVSAQIKVQRFHPALFWTVIVATTTFGTTLADFLDRSLGIGYAGGAAILVVLLVGSLALWRWRLGNVSVTHLTSRKAEMFYWLTVMFSQTLGTALGDWTADSTGLGYAGSAIVFSAGIAVLARLYFRTYISRTGLFWTAFILTRPLGATLGDLLDKPHAQGGLELSRYMASGAIAVVMVICIALLPQRVERQPSSA